MSENYKLKMLIGVKLKKIGKIRGARSKFYVAYQAYDEYNLLKSNKEFFNFIKFRTD